MCNCSIYSCPVALLRGLVWWTVEDGEVFPLLFSDVERGASAVSAPAGVLRVGFARGVSEREVRDACAEAFNREGVAFSVEEENGQLCVYVPAPAYGVLAEDGVLGAVDWLVRERHDLQPSARIYGGVQL